VLVYSFVSTVVVVASIVLRVEEDITVVGSRAIASVAITVVLRLVVGVAIVVITIRRLPRA
jgi:hypothetical protein